MSSACCLEGHPSKARSGPGFVVLEVMSMEKMPKAMGGNEVYEKGGEEKRGAE